MNKIRTTYVMTGESFFEPDVPIYVNRAQETFEMEYHSHEFLEITYVSEGSGVHYIADAAVPVEHGTLFFIPVGYSHVFRPKTPKKDTPLIVYNCLFPVSFIRELASAFPQASEIFSFFSEGSPDWFSMKDAAGTYNTMFKELYREFSAKPPGFLAVLSAIIVQILTGMYRHQMQIDAPAGDKPQWIAVDEIIAYIHFHYANPLKLNELAAKANLSERHFSRLFQAQTGMSFMNYLQSIRLEAACHLLTTGRSHVSEIASAVGYTDLKFFHSLFKRKIGITPQQYRKSMSVDHIRK